jgi:MFS family permease
LGVNSPFRIAFAGLAALAVAIGVGRFAFTPLLPMMQEDAGLTVTAGGWLASANYAGYLAGALAATAIPVRAATAIRSGLVAIGFATLAMGFETRFFEWTLLRAVAGIASAFVLIHVSAWSLERLTLPGRPWLTGVVFAGVGAGIACVGVLSIALMRATLTSRTAWIVFGVLSLGACLATWRVFEAGAAVPRHAVQPGEGSTGPRESAALVFSYAALGFGYIIPATFLPAMARELVRDPVVFGWSWPVFGAAAAASTIVAALLPPGVSNRHLLIASLATMAVGVALPVILPGIAGILLAALFVGGTFMVATMAGLKEARAAAGARPARLMAAMTAAFATGQIAGPLMVSFLVGGGGEIATCLLAACALLFAGACVLIRRKSA